MTIRRWKRISHLPSPPGPGTHSLSHRTCRNRARTDNVFLPRNKGREKKVVRRDLDRCARPMADEADLACISGGPAPPMAVALSPMVVAAIASIAISPLSGISRWTQCRTLARGAWPSVALGGEGRLVARRAPRPADNPPYTTHSHHFSCIDNGLGLEISRNMPEPPLVK